MKIEPIKMWIDAWEKSGRVAFHYPRLKKISLNGGRMLPEDEAIKKIAELLTNIVI